jgi:hypothetical protein
MRDAVRHPLPAMRSVLIEQTRSVALGLRPAASVAVVLMAVATFLVIGEFLTGGGPVDFSPELSLVPGLLGALMPIGVWKREGHFGPAFLWTLPVDRRRHALAKAFGGWVCLMASVSVFALWFLVLALITSGDLFGEQAVRVLPSETLPIPGTLDPSAVRTARFSPSPLFWLLPFTAATGAYVLASALALGSRYPLRWIIGGIGSLFVVSAVGAATNIDTLRFAASNLLVSVFEGTYGLDALLSARTESLHTVVTLANGTTIRAWRSLPNVGDWATATLLWIGVGLVALWAAASRHREQR